MKQEEKIPKQERESSSAEQPEAVSGSEKLKDVVAEQGEAVVKSLVELDEEVDGNLETVKNLDGDPADVEYAEAEAKKAKLEAEDTEREYGEKIALLHRDIPNLEDRVEYQKKQNATENSAVSAPRGRSEERKEMEGKTRETVEKDYQEKIESIRNKKPIEEQKTAGGYSVQKTEDRNTKALEEMPLEEVEIVFENIIKDAKEVSSSDLSLSEKEARIKRLEDKLENALNDKRIVGYIDKTKKWKEAGNLLHEIKKEIEKNPSIKKEPAEKDSQGKIASGPNEMQTGKRETQEKFSLKEVEEIFEDIKKRAEEIDASDMETEEKKQAIEKLMKEQEETINDDRVKEGMKLTKKWRESGNTLYRIKEEMGNPALEKKKDSHRIRKEIYTAQVAELKVKTAKQMGKNESEVLNEVLASDEYKKLDLYDELNDLDLKMARAEHKKDEKEAEELSKEEREMIINFIKDNDIAHWIFDRIRKFEQKIKEKEDWIKKTEDYADKLEKKGDDPATQRDGAARMRGEAEKLKSSGLLKDAKDELEKLVKQIKDRKY